MRQRSLEVSPGRKISQPAKKLSNSQEDPYIADFDIDFKWLVEKTFHTQQLRRIQEAQHKSRKEGEQPRKRNSVSGRCERFHFLESAQKGYRVRPASIFGTRGFPPEVKGAVFGGHTTNTVYSSITLGQSMRSHGGSTGIVSLFLEPRLSIGVGD